MKLFSPTRILRAVFQTTTLVGLVALVAANLAVSAYLADRKEKTLDSARTNARNLNTAFVEERVKKYVTINFLRRYLSLLPYIYQCHLIICKI
jgi:hypothetical protein